MLSIYPMKPYIPDTYTLYIKRTILSIIDPSLRSCMNNAMEFEQLNNLIIKSSELFTELVKDEIEQHPQTQSYFAKFLEGIHESFTISYISNTLLQKCDIKTINNPKIIFDKVMQQFTTNIMNSIYKELRDSKLNDIKEALMQTVFIVYGFDSAVCINDKMTDKSTEKLRDKVFSFAEDNHSYIEAKIKDKKLRTKVLFLTISLYIAKEFEYQCGLTDKSASIKEAFNFVIGQI